MSSLLYSYYWTLKKKPYMKSLIAMLIPTVPTTSTYIHFNDNFSYLREGYCLFRNWGGHCQRQFCFSFFLISFVISWSCNGDYKSKVPCASSWMDRPIPGWPLPLWKESLCKTKCTSLVNSEVEVKSAYEPSGPSGRSLTHFLWHEATRSISSTPG